MVHVDRHYTDTWLTLESSVERVEGQVEGFNRVLRACPVGSAGAASAQNSHKNTWLRTDEFYRPL